MVTVCAMFGVYTALLFGALPEWLFQGCVLSLLLYICWYLRGIALGRFEGARKKDAERDTRDKVRRLKRELGQYQVADGNMAAGQAYTDHVVTMFDLQGPDAELGKKAPSATTLSIAAALSAGTGGGPQIQAYFEGIEEGIEDDPIWADSFEEAEALLKEATKGGRE